MTFESNLLNTMYLGKMPFYWRIRASIDEPLHGIPPRLDYTFEYVPELDLVQSLQTETLWPTLEKMYSLDANIGFLKDGHTLAQGYGGDFLKYLKSFLKLNKTSKILEVGCGGCILLQELSQLGYDVTGVDPSPVAERAGRQKNIKVIHDFFPSPLLEEKFDLIFHVDVFEHIPNPVNFLNLQKKFLSENGSIIINVPDCTKSIEVGDISIAQHQHVNSFDESSLAKVINASGLICSDIARSGYGGSLYAIATKNTNLNRYKVTDSENGSKFFSKSVLNANKFKKQVNQLREIGKSIGFYMPLRAIPYMTFFNDFDDFRIFDDIEHWHEGFIDGLDLPIENFNDLKADPVDYLFVMSFTFGEQLRAKINEEMPSIIVQTLNDVITN